MSEQKKAGLYPDPNQVTIIDAGYNQIDDDNEVVASNQLRRM